MTERQTQVLNLFLDGYEAKITSKTWATLAKCSKDTAIRDIQDLVAKNILIEDIPGAKRPSYSIVYDAEDLTQFFTDVSITDENGIPYLKAMFKGKEPVSERLLKLDAERYQKGDLPLSNLLSKYCSYSSKLLKNIILWTLFNTFYRLHSHSAHVLWNAPAKVKKMALLMLSNSPNVYDGATAEFRDICNYWAWRTWTMSALGLTSRRPKPH